MYSNEPLPELVADACSRCAKDASKTCLGCQDAPVLKTDDFKISRTYYCSPACQRDDWKSHKTLCKKLQARKVIYRSSEILQDIFYNFEELTWEDDIRSIEKSHSKWILNYRIDIPKDKPFTSFKTFPHKLVGVDKEAKKTLLACHACDESVAWMSELVKYFLEGTAKISELRLLVRNNPLTLLRRSNDGEPETEEVAANTWHQIFHLSSRVSGEEYVLDMSGAQYGWMEPVIPWPIYETQRWRRVDDDSLQKSDLGTRRRDLRLAVVPEDPGLFRNFQNSKISPHLIDAVRSWEAEKGVNVGGILKMRGEEFEEMRRELVKYVEGKMIVLEIRGL